MSNQDRLNKILDDSFLHGNPSEQPVGFLVDDKQKAIETRDALMFRFGVEDPNKLHPRLTELHDITLALANATTDTERGELIEKIKEWYKLCDF